MNKKDSEKIELLKKRIDIIDPSIQRAINSLPNSKFNLPINNFSALDKIKYENSNLINSNILLPPTNKLPEIIKSVNTSPVSNILSSYHDWGIGKVIEDTTTNKLANSMRKVVNSGLSIASSAFLDSLSNPLSRLVQELGNINKLIMKSLPEFQFSKYTEKFKSLQESLEKAKNDPDSIYNWMKYYDLLSEFIWTLPYGITTEELNRILQNATTEKEFDKAIQKYFSKSKVNEMMSDIESKLKSDNKKTFIQVRKAYNDRYYALCGMGLIAIIDNLLSYYTLNKSCCNRKGIFEPIIEDMKFEDEDSAFPFIMYMLNSNINVLFEDYVFNKPINITTNKKSRRHPIEHGKLYNNKKIDIIMLMNTTYYILLVQEELKKYKSKLGYKNKKFIILSSKERRKIKNQLKRIQQ